jgi:SAM-dependent methyltransferase
MATPDGPNAESIEAWDTVLFDKYVRFRHIIDRGIDHISDAAFESVTMPNGGHVADLGCGFGGTTIEIAKRIGPDGRAIGIDASPRFVTAAEQEAREQGMSNVRFEVRDIQLEPLGGPFDVIFSRSGFMFVANPVQLFRNLKTALVPGGQLCFTVWRKREDNPWLTLAEPIAKALLPEPIESDLPTCGPGPFAMAGADVVSDQLLKAGFRRIRLERYEAPTRVGRDIDEAIKFSLALGPAGEAVRLAKEEGERRLPELEAEMRKLFDGHVRDDGVYLDASAWIVTAENPG